MTENVVDCRKCNNTYYNPSNDCYYCGAFIEEKKGIHIVDSYKREDEKWVDVFNCDYFKEQGQIKLDTRVF